MGSTDEERESSSVEENSDGEENWDTDSSDTDSSIENWDREVSDENWYNNETAAKIAYISRRCLSRLVFFVRYGEQNNSFIVASFESEEDDEPEISQKVNYAVDKVTSDYHSGSSSDEETFMMSHSENYHYHPHFVSGYQQRGRGNKMYGQMTWLPLMLQNEQNQCTNLHMMTAGHQCLV
ncbi:protein BTG3 [Ascaphus truei]|uniref:protein BTG3 n=1 Tax=Ascaphus truei TaxID=8439 RepID=UPI003F59F4E5